jgi:hypothetical protein
VPGARGPHVPTDLLPPVASIFPDRTPSEPVGPMRTPAALPRTGPIEGAVPPPAVRKTSPALELIKLKQRAQGDAAVPATRRVYLTVAVVPAGSGADVGAAPAVPPRAVYFDAERPVGWVLDRLVAQLRLPTLPTPWRLYAGDDGRMLPPAEPLGSPTVGLTQGAHVLVASVPVQSLRERR